VVGLKFTVIVTVWFGVSVTFVPPFALNPPPVVEVPEIITFAVPSSLSVTVCVAGVPIVTFPNETVVEVAVSRDEGAEVSPGDPLPPDEPPFPAELDVPISPQPVVPSMAASAIANVRTPAPEAILLAAFRSSVSRVAQFAEMDTPVTSAKIVERRACGKLLDAGTRVGQVLSPVRKYSHLHRPGGCRFACCFIDPALRSRRSFPIPCRPA
jgi:hypothetical protein